jgi:excisionase family DNA binding protein
MDRGETERIGEPKETERPFGRFAKQSHGRRDETDQSPGRMAADQPFRKHPHKEWGKLTNPPTPCKDSPRTPHESHEVGFCGLAHGLRIPDHRAVGEDRTGNGTPSGTPSGTDRASDRDTYYTVTEAAKVLGITGRRVRALAQEGRIEGERLEGGWKLFRSSVHAFRDERRDREATSAVRESFLTTSELLDRVSALERALGRAEGRLELTEQAESTVRQERDRLLKDLEDERSERRRLAERLDEAQRPWWQRWFGG